MGVPRVLLGHGTNVEAQDRDNQTPLHFRGGGCSVSPQESSAAQMRTPWAIKGSESRRNRDRHLDYLRCNFSLYGRKNVDMLVAVVAVAWLVV